MKHRPADHTPSSRDPIAIAEARLAELRRGETGAWPSALLDRIFDGEPPLKVFREHRGLTRKALAEAVAVSSSHIARIERGDRRASRTLARALSGILNVPLNDLDPCNYWTGGHAHEKNG